MFFDHRVDFSFLQKENCNGCRNHKPPIALAGPDQLITFPKDSTILDGSASNDPDGTITKWFWRKISGPAFIFYNWTKPIAIVKNLKDGIYLFELKVTDNVGLTATDTIKVVVDASLKNQR